MIIFAFDASDDAAVTDAVFRGSKAVPIGSGVQTMVYNVLGALGSATIDRLHIVDHGWGSYTEYNKRVNGKSVTVTEGFGGFEIGDDDITRDTIKGYAVDLSKLKPRFAPGGTVYLHNCYVGRDKELLKMVSWAVGVPVTASTEPVQAATGFHAGVMVTAYPNGDVLSDVSLLKMFMPR